MNFKRINRGFFANWMRFVNVVDNMLDVVVLLVIAFGIGLLAFSFNFSFSLLPLYWGGRLVGLEPFDIFTRELVAGLVKAAASTMRNVIILLGTVVAYVVLRRGLTRPKSMSGILLLFVLCSPFPLTIFSDALGQRWCIYPFSDLSASGAAILGRSSHCEQIFTQSADAHFGMGTVTALYAIATIPLTLAFFGSIGLVVWRLKNHDISLTRMALWPRQFLRYLPVAFRARAAPKQLWGLVWIFGLAVLFPMSVMLPIFPEPSATELGWMRAMIPDTSQERLLENGYIAIYADLGRQVIAALMIITLLLAVSRRWVAAMLVAAALGFYPVLVHYFVTNHYLTLVSNNYMFIFISFLFLIGWALYVATFSHWRNLIEFVTTSCILAARRATKEVNAALRPIIFLRPFRFDKLPARTLSSLALRMLGLQKRTKSVEACIAEEAFRVAPLVALGDPQIATEPIGALREYTSNDTWQSRISDFLEAPRAVIFLVGATSATKWEVEILLANDLLDRTVFVFPKDSDLTRAFFQDNPSLFQALGLGQDDLHKAIKGRACALWRTKDEQVCAFFSGAMDELSYSAAIRFGLADVGA